MANAARAVRVARLKRQNRRLTRRVNTYKAQAKEASKALYDPMAPLSGSALSSAANQLTDLTIKPQLSALDRQSSTATTQGTALADRAKQYYTSLGANDDKFTAHQQALGDLLTAAQAQAGARATQAYDAAQAGANQAQAQDVALRGAGLSGGGQDAVNAEIAAGRSTSAQNQAQAEMGGNIQSSNWAGLAGAIGQARQFQGQESYNQLLNRLANTQAEIAGKRADVQSTRGQELTKNILQLRDTGFTNEATRLGLGLDQAKIDAQAAQDAAAAKEAAAKRKQSARDAAADRRTRARIAAENNATSAANNAATNATSRANTRDRITASKDKPRAESSQAVQLRRSVNNVSAEAATLARSLTGSKAQIRDAVAKKLNQRARSQQMVLPNDVLSAALDIALDGHISTRNSTRLKQAGVQIPSNWLG